MSKKKVKNYVVADGHEIVCLKGKLKGGQEVKPDYIAGDKKYFDGLVKQGAVVEKPESK